MIRLCIGTGRTPLSRRSPSDNDIITTSLLVTKPGQEMRLGLMAQLFDIAECGCRIRLPGYSELEKWDKEVTQVLTKMDQLQRILSPLPGKDLFIARCFLLYTSSTRQ